MIGRPSVSQLNTATAVPFLTEVLKVKLPYGLKTISWITLNIITNYITTNNVQITILIGYIDTVSDSTTSGIHNYVDGNKGETTNLSSKINC